MLKLKQADSINDGDVLSVHSIEIVNEVGMALTVDCLPYKKPTGAVRGGRKGDVKITVEQKLGRAIENVLKRGKYRLAEVPRDYFDFSNPDHWAEAVTRTLDHSDGKTEAYQKLLRLVGVARAHLEMDDTPNHLDW